MKLREKINNFKNMPKELESLKKTGYI